MEIMIFILYYIIICVFVCYLFSSILDWFLCSFTHSVLSVISHNNDVNQLGRGPFFYFDFSCTPCIMEKILISVTAYCNMIIEIQIYIPIVDSCQQTYVNKITTHRRKSTSSSIKFGNIFKIYEALIIVYWYQ